MVKFLKKKNEAAKEELLQALKALDVMPEMWRTRCCSFKTDICVDVDERSGELQLHITRTVKGRDANLSRSTLAYRCHGIKEGHASKGKSEDDRFIRRYGCKVRGYI